MGARRLSRCGPIHKLSREPLGGRNNLQVVRTYLETVEKPYQHPKHKVPIPIDIHSKRYVILDTAGTVDYEYDIPLK